MAKNSLQRLADEGQSVWYDNLSRELLRKGELTRLIGLGVLGVTVNPTIFEKAVSEGDAYDDEIRELALAWPLHRRDLRPADLGRRTQRLRRARASYQETALGTATSASRSRRPWPETRATRWLQLVATGRQWTGPT